MATALIVVALLVGGLGAIRWRHRAAPTASIVTGSADGTALAGDAASVAVEGLPPAESPATTTMSPTAEKPVVAEKPAKPRRAGKKPADPATAGDDLLAASADIDALDAVFDRVLESHSRELGILLASRLQRLVDRRVPVRAIRDAPGTSAARVCFADGTIVLARGMVPGDFVRIAWGIHISSVWLQGFSRVDATTRLDLRWHDGRVAVVALGLDQPD